jgi:hypothetical protein
MFYRILLLILFTTSNVQASELTGSTYQTIVNKDGKINLPQNYRSQWTHIGSWIIADVSAPGYGFHDVYIQPEAVKYYRETGRFADGTVIVKEVREVEEGHKTTGLAQWAGDIKIWFVMVKDEYFRFNDSPHWAKGWGWALFENNNSEGAAALQNVSKGFSASCQGCHVPAQSNDWIYIEGYPTLNSK